MKLRWLGHSAWLLTAADGTKIVFDPFRAGAYDGGIGYPPINETADVLLMSHTGHPDHGYAAAVRGKPQTFAVSGTHKVKGVTITGLDTFHDESKGKERGKNVVFTVEMDGLKITHFGDLGHELSDEQYDALKGTNVALIPVGGFFTIDAKTATRIVQRLKPNVAIPMHYKTPMCGFPIAPATDFTRGKSPVEQKPNEVEITKATLPPPTSYWVFALPAK
jgi:L-ascorbate metabolism protein UlaG (beta-lactamase superfamily)